MEIETVPIDSVTPDPANARLHPQKNLDAIKGSLKRFGQQIPLVVDEQSIIRKGNGTWSAAKSLGWAEIRITRTALKGAEATAYALADNRASELSSFDPDATALLLADLRVELPDLPMALLGFEDLMKVEDLPPPPTPTWEPAYQILITCNDEQHQAQLLEEFQAKGLDVRALLS